MTIVSLAALSASRACCACCFSFPSVSKRVCARRAPIWPCGACVCGRWCLLFFALSEMRFELCEAHGVEHAVLRHGAFAGHQHAPLDVVDFFGRVGVGIDAEQASQLQPARAPAPVEIETPRVGVDLDGNAVFGAGLQDLLHVHFVAGTSQQLPSRDMAEDCGARVGNGSDDAFGLLGFCPCGTGRARWR